MLVSEGHARKWMGKIGWTQHFDDFSKQKGYREKKHAFKLAEELHKTVLVIFPKTTDQRKIQQCTPQPDEPGFDYCDRLEKTFKQYYGINKMKRLFSFIALFA